MFVSSFSTPSNDVLEYNGTTGAFVSTFAFGGGLNFPSFLAFEPGATVATPEPASLWLLGSGLIGGWAARAWRRRRAGVSR